MEDGFENIGAAITGGLAARAIEPEAGEGRPVEHPGECANCSVPLIGPHCHFCGQKAHVHRTLTAIFHDLVHGVLHLDGKFWRTLPLLIWRPGELTRRYAHGERAKFVSPMGMFLFTVFLMFAVLSIAGVSLSNVTDGDFSMVNPQTAIEGLDERIAETEAAIRRAEQQEDEGALAAGAATGDEDAPSAEREGELRERLANLREARQGMERLANGEPDAGFQFISNEIHTGWERLDHGIQKLNDNPGLALYKLQSNFYKFSWLLIPISVPFVWLLFFWTRRFRMYDHSVFVTYSLSFMSLLAIVLTLLGFMGVIPAIISIAAIFLPPIHIYRQLKGAYRLGWFGALVRTIILTNFCFLTAGLFFTLLLGIGVLG